MRFAEEYGYGTPKIDMRGVVLSEGRVLLVREIGDTRWTLPGGWADVGESPGRRSRRRSARRPGSPAAPPVCLPCSIATSAAGPCGPPTRTRCTSSASRATARRPATGWRPRPPRTSTRRSSRSSRSRRPAEHLASVLVARRRPGGRRGARLSVRERVRAAARADERVAEVRGRGAASRERRGTAGRRAAPQHEWDGGAARAPSAGAVDRVEGGVPVSGGRGRASHVSPAGEPIAATASPRAASARPPRCRTGTPRRRARMRLPAARRHASRAREGPGRALH